MRPSSPLRILLLTTLLVAAAAVLLVVSGPAYADPGTAPADGVWPLDPRPEVVSRFDPPATRWGAGHRGRGPRRGTSGSRSGPPRPAG